jgi:hypothetical protein
MQSRSGQRFMVLLIAIVLVLIVAARTPHLTTTYFHHDEVWSIYSTFGTPGQIITWTPYDWNPLFYLMVGVWKELVGIHPTALRWMSLLIFLIGLAALYRIGKRLFSATAGLIAVAAYAAIGYGLYQSIILRGYVLLATGGLLLFWAALRYFHKPSLRRALPMAIMAALLFYTQLTSVIIIGMIALFVLITATRKILYGILPAALAVVFALPQLIEAITVKLKVVAAAPANAMKPISVMLPDLYQNLAAEAAWVWGVVLIVATVLLSVSVFRVARINRSKLSALLADASLRRKAALFVWLTMPIVLVIAVPTVARRLVDPTTALFLPRYFWWLFPAAALWAGAGLSLLPRQIWAVFVIAFLAISFIFEPRHYQDQTSPYNALFRELGPQARWGDAILIDPYWQLTEDFMWEYYTRVYLPNGVNITTQPDGFRRVWYLTREGQQDSILYDKLQKRYIAGQIVGSPEMQLRLYEAAPDPIGTLFENGMRFHGLDMLDTPLPNYASTLTDESVRVRLWWSVDQPVTLDYSASVQMQNPCANMAVIAQSDSAPTPTNGPNQTSRWQPNHLYVEERTLNIPTEVMTGVYPLYLTVYQWWDGKRIAAPNVNENTQLLANHLFVKSWWVAPEGRCKEIYINLSYPGR